jgi:hypothetical protein
MSGDTSVVLGIKDPPERRRQDWCFLPLVTTWRRFRLSFAGSPRSRIPPGRPGGGSRDTTGSARAEGTIDALIMRLGPVVRAR